MIYTIVIDGGASLGNEQTAAAFIAHTIKTDIGEALRLVRLAGRVPVWQGGDLSAAVAIHSSLSSAGFVCRIDQIILPSPDQAVSANTTELLAKLFLKRSAMTFDARISASKWLRSPCLRQSFRFTAFPHP